MALGKRDKPTGVGVRGVHIWRQPILVIFDLYLCGTCWREVWLVLGGGGGVGEYPSVDARIHSTG